MTIGRFTRLYPHPMASSRAFLFHCVCLVACWSWASCELRAQWDDLTEMYLLEATTQASWFGTGMSAADFNLDGLDDFTFANSDGTVVAYAQLPEGGFELAHQILGSADAQGVVWFDVDGDDDLDLMLSRRFSGMELYLRDGVNLVESAAASGLPTTDEWEMRGLSVADYDQDGDLDVYVCMYHDGTTGLSENLLLNNDGEGYFTDVTTEAGVGNGIQHSFQGSWFDFDGDGDLDLWVVNDREIFPNALYANLGDGTFIDVAPQMGAAQEIFAMSATVGDPDNDGEFELFCTNVENMPNVYLDKIGAAYVSVGPAVGLDGMQYSWGGCWVDADGDMWSDLMVATYRFPNSLPYDNYYYSNELQGTLFEDQTEAVWPNEQTQLYCVAACDINQDLAPDVVGFGNMPYAQILQNNGVGGGADAGRLTVELCGTSSNRLAIGAEVNVYAGGVTQMQLVSCGSDYMTQQSWKRFFGLADAGIVDSVVVEWPGGASEAWYDIPVNTELRLVEGTSDAAVSVLGSSCAGDSAWLVFPFEAPVRTLNGVEVFQDSVYLASGGTYVAACQWLNGLFQWTDTLEWTQQPAHGITVEWTEPDCAGEEGSIGWVVDPGLYVVFDGDSYPEVMLNLGTMAGPLAVQTVDSTGGCIETHTYDLPEPAALGLYVDYDAALCADDSAQAIAAGFGGSPGYLVNWNGANPLMLTEGEVVLTLTDAQGCTLDSAFSVAYPAPLVAEVLVVNEDAGNDGAISLSVSGGSVPYDFLWNTGASGDSVLTGLGVGLYSWVITDANGCLLLGIQDIINMDVAEWNGQAGWSAVREEAGLRLLGPESPAGLFRLEIHDQSGRLVLGASLGASRDALVQWSEIPAHGIVVVRDALNTPVLRAVY